jgi:isoleucyl-tRNA synthetase
MVKFLPGSGDIITVKAMNSNLIKCERCWQYYDATDMNGDVCKRCHDVINN